MNWRSARGMTVAAGAAGLVASLSLPATSLLAGAETPLDKYQVLLQQKRELARKNAILQQEATIAATKSPYIFFHLEAPKLEFRVRGRALKTYAFTSMSMDERGRIPADAETLWKYLQEPLTVVEIEGAHPELIPPDPNSSAEAGLLYSDPNQLSSQTGAASVPVHTDAGVLGVDVPTDYYVRFEEKVVLHVRTPKTLTFRQQARDRLDEIAENLTHNLSTWWGRKELDNPDKPRLEIYLTTDADTAKNLHYSLLPGERVFAVPPPPPAIALVAAGTSSGATPKSR